MPVEILRTFEAINLVEEDYFLQSEMRWYQMEVAFEILSLAKNVIIDLREHPAEEPADCINLLGELSKLSQGAFHFKEPEIRWVDPKYSKLLISFISNERSYQAPIWLMKYNVSYKDDEIGASNLIRVVNQALIENGSEKRFHHVDIIERRGGGGVIGSAIIFLTPKQRQIILEKELLSLPNAELEIDPWTMSQTSEVISELHDLGMISHLEESEIAESEQQIAVDDIMGAASILTHFPGLTYSFDLECLYDPADAILTELITEISNLSKGKFQPEDVDVEVDNGNDPDGGRDIKVSFHFKGQSFHCDLEDWGDFVDDRFIALMNHSLATFGVDGRYYGVVDGQFVTLFFLTNGQRKRFEEKRWIKFHSFELSET